MNTNATWLQRNSLTGYFFLAYAISWSIGIPLALIAQEKVNWEIPFAVHYLYSYGPMLAALIMTALTKGKSGMVDIFKRLTTWRMRPVWWLLALSPLPAYFLIVIVLRLIQGTWVDLSLLGQVNFLPNLGIGALFLWIFTYGIGEEVGWRGYALPRLQEKMSALNATLLLGVLWALWHLPIFFYVFDTAIAVGWFFGLMCGAILFTWMYNSTDGSLLAVALWHGSFNFITASGAGEGLGAAIMSTLVMIWAIVLIFIYKPANLSTREKQVAG
ncbi:MAG: CPBP family intramembrane metalloprotease [Anaerolineae bacterium]|nr:CPBP family intramembrane metalloprotease [Anaerolineae bacterium]